MTLRELCRTLHGVLAMMRRGERVPSEFVKGLLYAHIDELHTALRIALGGDHVDENSGVKSVGQLQQLLNRKQEQIRNLQAMLELEQQQVQELSHELKMHEDNVVEMSRLLTAIMANRHLVMIPERNGPRELHDWTSRVAKALNDYDQYDR